MPIHACPITTLALAMLLLWGCDFPGGTKEDPPELQTRILEVRVEPDPVAVGDTTTFTAIIEDSLDTSFRFRWNVDNTPLIYTDNNCVKWTAPPDPGTYGGAVTADNGDPERLPATAEFSIRVSE